MSDFIDNLIAKLPYVFNTEIDYLRNLGASLNKDSHCLMLGVGPGEMALLLYEGAERAGNEPLSINGQKTFFNFWCVDNASLSTYIAHMASMNYNPGYMLNYRTSDIYHDFKDESFDLIIVDASHTYESVKEDILHYWPKLKIGAIILFHDFVALEPDNGVARAVEELKTDTWQEIDRPGVSIVFKKLA